MGQTSTAVVSLQMGAVGTSEELAISIEVYPNPASGNVTVRSTFDQTTSLNAILLNSLGQQICSQVLVKTEDKFSLAGVSAGVYFLQLQSGDKTLTRKLAVE